MQHFRSLLCISLLLLSACSSLQPTSPFPSDWSTHQNSILSQPDWRLQGRLNIRSHDESNTIAINWQQDQQQFLINLSGTLGLGAVQIRGNEQLVSVEKAGEEAISANTLEEISSHYLGYEFPTSALYYWVRGIPVPGTDSSKIELDEAQHLKRLSQQDNQHNEWQLEYDRYKMVEGVFLPSRIKMQHPAYRLTFIISQWQLNSDI